MAGARTRANESNLNDMTVEDLKDQWRLAALVKQARKRGWVRKTEAEILAVFSSAAHAMRVASVNPAGLFVWLVRQKQWDYLSIHDEDRARYSLKQIRGEQDNRLNKEFQTRATLPRS